MPIPYPDDSANLSSHFQTKSYRRRKNVMGVRLPKAHKPQSPTLEVVSGDQSPKTRNLQA